MLFALFMTTRVYLHCMQSVLIKKYIFLDIIWFHACISVNPQCVNNAYAHIRLHGEGDMPNLPMHHARLHTAGMVDERKNKKLFMMPRIYI